VNSLRKLQNKVRVYALARVSTSAQAEVEHGSLEQQAHIFRRWAADRTRSTGIEHELLEENIYSEDVSGRAKSAHKRTGLLAIRSAVRIRACDIVVIEKLDRLGRSQDLNREFIRECSENDVAVYEVESGLIDLKDRGSRLGFNMKNIFAEEYSLDLEEKISRKQREARVNSQKDTSSAPILGLDVHQVRAGFYVRVESEIIIVRDIFETFCQLKSYEQLKIYCAKKGYRTKTRQTREKIVRGERVPPKTVGGETFDAKRLRALLTNRKIRGWGTFKDTWNQFPQRQDENGHVRWEYAHGPLLEQDLFDRVDVVIASIVDSYTRTSETRGIYLLSGLLKSDDGSSFYGASAKGGKYHYYYNSKNGQRIPADLLDDMVCGRATEYLKDSTILRGIVAATYKHQNIGIPLIDADIAAARNKIKELETIIEKFSRSLRQAALSDTVDVGAVCAALIEEKSKAARDLERETEILKGLVAHRDSLKDSNGGNSINDHMKRTLAKFQAETGIRKKRILQEMFPEIVVKSETELEIKINPATFESDRCHTGGNRVRVAKWRDGRDLNPWPPP
jgi:DNA invertase Pin-like site-specific DNA recombinase